MSKIKQELQGKEYLFIGTTDWTFYSNLIDNSESKYYSSTKKGSRYSTPTSASPFQAIISTLNDFGSFYNKGIICYKFLKKNNSLQELYQQGIIAAYPKFVFLAISTKPYIEATSKGYRNSQYQINIPISLRDIFCLTRNSDLKRFLPENHQGMFLQHQWRDVFQPNLISKIRELRQRPLEEAI